MTPLVSILLRRLELQVAAPEADGLATCGGGRREAARARAAAPGPPAAPRVVEVDPRKLGKRIYGVPVVTADEGAELRDAIALGAVSGADARARLRELASAQGRVDGVDFFATAPRAADPEGARHAAVDHRLPDREGVLRLRSSGDLALW